MDEKLIRKKSMKMNVHDKIEFNVPCIDDPYKDHVIDDHNRKWVQDDYKHDELKTINKMKYQ